MLGAKRNNRIIADCDIGLPDDWHPVDLDPETSPVWARELAGQLTPDGETAVALSKRLDAVVEAVRFVNAPQLTTAVWIPDPASAEVASILAFGLVQLAEGQGPEVYQASLNSDEGRTEPGVEFQTVRTWTARVDAGYAVGGYNRIVHTEPDGRTRVEDRTVIGVFPPRSKEMIECIFTAQSPDAFDDIVEETMALAATITVELERG